MNDITVIGLGLMGSALARAIQRAGHGLTVWNRSPAKMQPFIDDGVVGAPSIASAISASSVVLICIDNYNPIKFRPCWPGGQSFSSAPELRVKPVSHSNG
jgi:3-hydroxyisobutyrate dehydrogenase-like beta-hydroxyacid dehydrogenase